ncbi:hydantoinase/oxoprolinase family protein [Marinobacterium sedimentorum]|uniref:hydantoinase/oxoprolinase family protein n=1 Tax=Marinobacterium sedimentorum TaxID=2927804 RepID=UPI0020C6E8DC|nr:hydantoinase/oxoprolinase family protein [Marinobacterium sedimentorum]MCP8687340.1 hydantoinase/oxoprolinase family protein [Marinobacterium sedimentorum]
MNQLANPVEVLGIDAGGTMTDTFFVRADGEFVVGKAQSNINESQAVLESSRDALAHWDRTVEDVYPEMVTCVFSGTAMLNRVVGRKGLRTGLIVSKGFEDFHRMGRAIQSYLGYAFEDRIHLNTHRYDEPLVHIKDTRGVTERIDSKGNVVIPVRLHEAREAARELIEQGCKAIVISLLSSYLNEAHEKAVRDVCKEVAKEMGVEIPVFASVDYYPVRKESHRTNTTILEAYAAEPSRATLGTISDSMKDVGGKFDLRVMASHGGTISWKAKELARSLVSGPIGGVIGAKFLGEKLGYENIACSDIGGTSFDMALITKNNFAIHKDGDMARLVLSLPLVAMDTIGAGAGSFVRIDPHANAIKLGPDSAGYKVGTCWPDGGIDTVSVTDCHIILGYLNPENFLGGILQLDVERARREIKRQVADPLGLSVEDAAAGVIELLDLSLRQHLRAMITGKGYSPTDFVCFSYGGGGPVHAYGYTKGLGFKETIVPAWAAGFSAFGCATADFEYRYDKSVDIGITEESSTADIAAATTTLQAAWNELRTKVLEEFRINGFKDDEVTLTPGYSMQYLGQLNDLEIDSPVSELSGADDWDALVDSFNSTYARVYADAARSPELGYGITGAIMRGSVVTKKPNIPEEPDAGPVPSAESRQGTRPFYYEKQWVDAEIFKMELLKPGNEIKGPAVIESDATTYVVPPGFETFLDVNRLFHLIEC